VYSLPYRNRICLPYTETETELAPEPKTPIKYIVYKLFVNMNMIMGFWTSQRTLERSLQHLGKNYVKSTVMIVTVRVIFENCGKMCTPLNQSDCGNFVMYITKKFIKLWRNLHAHPVPYIAIGGSWSGKWELRFAYFGLGKWELGDWEWKTHAKMGKPKYRHYKDSCSWTFQSEMMKIGI
jgi:hypothetical protein